MRKSRMGSGIALGVVLAMGAAAMGQTGAPAAGGIPPAEKAGGRSGAEARRVRFVFTLRELDERGKVVNTRQYDAVVGSWNGDHAEASIRTGVRVPIYQNLTQWSYYDVGADFDLSNVRWIGPDRVALRVSANLSSLDRGAGPGGGTGVGTEGGASSRSPTVLQNKWSGDEEMGVGERTVLFRSDDLTSRNRLELSLAVERVD